MTGFYDIKKLDTKTLKKFYKDALMLSFSVRCQSKYVEHQYRGESKKYSISDFFKMVSVKNHNICIDRSIQHRFLKEDGTIQIMPDCEVGEIAFKLNYTFDKDWHQINFHISLENLKQLTEKYGLVMN